MTQDHSVYVIVVVIYLFLWYVTISLMRLNLIHESCDETWKPPLLSITISFFWFITLFIVIGDTWRILNNDHKGH